MQKIENIKPPFGYQVVVPLLKQHRVREVSGVVPEAMRNSNGIPVSMVEITRAGKDYPVVFISPDEGQTFNVVALLGFAAGQNLFVSSAGQWDSSVYVPAYVRRYPFCMSTLAENGKVQAERIVCVEESFIDEENGMPQTNEKGEETPWWQARLHLLQEYEADLLRTTQFCSMLKKFGLLVPFTAQAVSASGQVFNLSGLYRVDEDRMTKLCADDLRTLIRKGAMGRIYAHMISLDNLAKLVDRISAIG